MTGALSIGIAAAAGPAVAAATARAAERAGLRALWVNDTVGHDALAVLAAAAEATDRLVLATGVLPVDRRSPREILERAAGLPQDRLVLGIGSGQARTGAVDRVRDAVAELRAGTSARIVVGALGPRMRRLGAAASDGLLLSWLTPELARAQSAEAHDGAPDTHVALYVRAASDPAAVGRLRAEADTYAGYAVYRSHFDRVGIGARDTTIEPTALTGSIPRYRDAADELVLRVMTAGDTADEYVRFIDDVRSAVR
ncbi:LLM class flavin-dependent oxidoreductase [Microbacterium sp. NPDC055357]